MSKKFRRLLFFNDQDGFFDASVTRVGAKLRDYRNLEKLEKYQAVIVSVKSFDHKGNEQAIVGRFSRIFLATNLKKALLIGAAKADYLPPNELLDMFDVIIKREPFKDRDRYDISNENRIKIVPTMIHCPFVHSPRDNWISKMYHLVRPKVQPCRPEEAVYEVGFSGADAADHSLRRDVWQRVVDEDFTKIGGLQPNPVTKEPIPEKLQGPRYKGRAYRDALCRAKINLALDGIGQYTFRHQELLYLGAFMMSGPSIRELELPMPLEEDVHYVAFDDLDDMVSKIRYYLAHEDERLQIAAAGKALFDEYYDPVRHGREIVAALERVQR